MCEIPARQDNGKWVCFNFKFYKIIFLRYVNTLVIVTTNVYFQSTNIELGNPITVIQCQYANSCSDKIPRPIPYFEGKLESNWGVQKMIFF